MGKIIYKNLDKSPALNSYIIDLLQTYQLEGSHTTIEKRNKIYSLKVSTSNGRYVVSKKGEDLYHLAEKVITILNRQIKDYESKKLIYSKRSKYQVEEESSLNKIKKFIVKPTDENNALEHMKVLGHKFYIYINNDNQPSMLFEYDGEIYSQQSFEQYSLDEAILKLLEENKNYIAFNNKEEEDVLTVVYRRKSGDVGIIDASI